jgi:hypothetical protein
MGAADGVQIFCGLNKCESLLQVMWDWPGEFESVK